VQLDALCVSGTGITLTGLRMFLLFPNLKELNVYSCPHITPEEIMQFKEEAATDAVSQRLVVNVG